MSITVEAVYEAGVLKPLIPLPEPTELPWLADHATVRVTIEPAVQAVPRVRYVPTARIDCSLENEWLNQNQDAYRGQWVVLAGDRLFGHTASSAAVTALVEQARAAGVQSPFVHFINEQSEPVWMGWL